ncbi:MAG: LuxR C-terminal-related transcriptional regulator, partial [Pseudomonadota bacterium]|nr:LuxR C-terminal-related transcriptional regulator [Pseudomonadota bacterium]
GLAVNLANQLLDTNVDIAAKLTKREFEIFIAIAMNKSRFDVADELGLSAKTVSNALTVIKRKLDAVPSQFSAIAAKHGYIGDAELSASQSVSFVEKSEK